MKLPVTTLRLVPSVSAWIRQCPPTVPTAECSKPAFRALALPHPTPAGRGMVSSGSRASDPFVEGRAEGTGPIAWQRCFAVQGSQGDSSRLSRQRLAVDARSFPKRPPRGSRCLASAWPESSSNARSPSLKALQELGLVEAEVPILLAPTIIGLLGDPKLTDDIGRHQSLRQLDFRLLELPDDLLRGVASLPSALSFARSAHSRWTDLREAGKGRRRAFVQIQASRSCRVPLARR
jgi:hypothetical protein